MFSKVNQLMKKKSGIQQGTIKGPDGGIVSDPEGVRNRWREYVEELYDKKGQPMVLQMEMEKEHEVEEDEKDPAC